MSSSQTPAADSPAQEQEAEQRLSCRLRPGVAFPDWSVITSASARATLVAMLDAAWDRRAWHGYSPSEDAVRRTILELYRELGRGPSLSEIAGRLQAAPEPISSLLDRLVARDLIVLEGGAIKGAYPLTDRATEHRVRIDERTLHAMCAIDALGSGAMYRTDVGIESRCRWCRAPIEIETRARGQALQRVSPREAVVVARISYRGSAATSLCTGIAFACGAPDLSALRADPSPGGPTFALSIDEALEVGRALFGPVLAPATGDRAELPA